MTGTRTRARRSRGRAEDGSDRRREVLDVAAELFAERGFRSTTVRDVAERANILSGSLYYHFDSKEAMVDEILRSFLDDILARYRAVVSSGEPPRGQFSLLVRESFASVDRHRAAITIFQVDAESLSQSPMFAYLTEARAEIESVWTGVIARSVADGSFRATVNQRLVYRFLRDTIWVAVRWYRPGGSLTPELIADDYLALLMDGLANPGHTE